MTRPDRPASAKVSEDALFGPEAAGYACYRPGLPDALVHLLAATQHGVPAPVRRTCTVDVFTRAAHTFGPAAPGRTP